jgi:vitamin B12 transporter
MTRKSGDLPSPSFVRLARTSKKAGAFASDAATCGTWDTFRGPPLPHAWRVDPETVADTYMSLRRILLLAPLGLLLTTPAFAQTAVETITVTATRTPQALTKVGSSITVITSPEILIRQPLAITDLLVNVQGVSVTRNGGLGSLTSVRIRGAEADQTLVLVDGIKLNDPASPGGGFDFGNLLVGDIARVEVLRGPQSTLYGSQAIGGVINVITQKSTSPFEGSVDLETGELATSRVRGAVRGQQGAFSYAGSLGYLTTDGISAAASGTEADSFKHRAAQGKVGFNVNSALDLEARAWWAKGVSGIDGFPPPTFSFSDTPETSTTEQTVFYASANLILLDGRSRTRLGFSQAKTDRVNATPTQSVRETFLALGTNDQIDVQSSLDIGQSLQIVAGGEFETSRLRVSSPSSFNPNPTPLRANTKVSGLYIQGQATPTPWLTATLGARWTSNSRYGDATNVRATLAASFNEGETIVRGALANGFKAPTLYQIFSEFGNLSLVPEEASSAEIGVEQAVFSRKLIIGLTAFSRDTTNQIDFASCFGSNSPICVNRPFGVYNNIARAYAEGIETSLTYKPTKRFDLAIGYTALNTTNRSLGNANFGKDLARRPKDTGFINLSYQFDFGLNLSGTYSTTGDSFNNASNSVRLAGYELIALRASQKLSDIWTIYARVDNAGEETYQTAAGYNSPPRQAYVGLRATF